MRILRNNPRDEARPTGNSRRIPARRSSPSGFNGKARALLFPSHYEGWGLPLREAAVRGCPIAAGDCPAAREALGSYAGATLLSSDDAGPWADYMGGDHPRVDPVDFHPWFASARELLEAIELTSGSRRRSPR